jgi:hypothetical protein
MVTTATDLADMVQTRRRALSANAGKTATFRIRAHDGISHDGGFGREANQVFHSVEAVDPGAIDLGKPISEGRRGKMRDRETALQPPARHNGACIGSGNYKISAEYSAKPIRWRLEPWIPVIGIPMALEIHRGCMGLHASLTVCGAL